MNSGDLKATYGFATHPLSVESVVDIDVARAKIGVWFCFDHTLPSVP
jgi:hypothetical protein